MRKTGARATRILHIARHARHAQLVRVRSFAYGVFRGGVGRSELLFVGDFAKHIRHPQHLKDKQLGFRFGNERTMLPIRLSRAPPAHVLCVLKQC